MWPNLQFPADLVRFTEKSLMKNFIFSAVCMTWVYEMYEMIFYILAQMHHTIYLWLLNVSLLQLHLIDTWWWPEGSYEIVSMRPSVPLSVPVFSWNWIIRFPRILACARNPYEIVHERTRVFGKKIFAPKIGEMGQKRCFWI